MCLFERLVDNIVVTATTSKPALAIVAHVVFNQDDIGPKWDTALSTLLTAFILQGIILSCGNTGKFLCQLLFVLARSQLCQLGFQLLCGLCLPELHMPGMLQFIFKNKGNYNTHSGNYKATVATTTALNTDASISATGQTQSGQPHQLVFIACYGSYKPAVAATSQQQQLQTNSGSYKPTAADAS
ncbi:hypothetical protein BCV70DRAFT_209027 [Testicularia cyperi]|uniref:Uncharacterized protein n=1 Tax=Testicularia cyperi TaxID=1882483 RepID=A0A317XF87_9BASI|nr:hypothetical protein BCV70DRAFT_209027 [Testicularia cyperi]